MFTNPCLTHFNTEGEKRKFIHFFSVFLRKKPLKFDLLFFLNLLIFLIACIYCFGVCCRPPVKNRTCTTNLYALWPRKTDTRWSIYCHDWVIPVLLGIFMLRLNLFIAISRCHQCYFHLHFKQLKTTSKVWLPCGLRSVGCCRQGLSDTYSLFLKWLSHWKVGKVPTTPKSEAIEQLQNNWKISWCWGKIWNCILRVF